LSVFEVAAKATLPAWQSVFGDTVTYTRGVDSVEVTAIRTEVEVETQDVNGVFLRDVMKVFYIKKTDLILSEVQATPEAKDTITAAGIVYKYMEDYEYKIDTGEYMIPVTEIV